MLPAFELAHAYDTAANSLQWLTDDPSAEALRDAGTGIRDIRGDVEIVHPEELRALAASIVDAADDIARAGDRPAEAAAFADRLVNLQKALASADDAEIERAAAAVSEALRALRLRAAPPGDGDPIKLTTLACPYGDYSVPQDQVGGPAPVCPHHNVPLQPQP